MINFGIIAGLLNEDKLFEGKCAILEPLDIYYTGYTAIQICCLNAWFFAHWKRPFMTYNLSII